MKMRMFSLLLVVAMLVTLVPAISAQGGEDMCFNLAEADCTILMTAMANSENISSFSFEYNFDAVIGGLDSAAMMMGEGGGGMGDITVGSAGEGTIMEAADQVPPMMFELAFDGNVFDGTETTEGTAAVKMVDGMVYFAVDGEWAGASFADLMAANPELGGMLGDGEELPTEALSPDELSGMLGEFGIDEASATALMDVPGFINAERGADAEFAGQTMQVFTTTIDFTPLFQSMEFSEFLNGMSTAMMETDPETAQVFMFLPMILMGAELSITQSYWVGADDVMVHGFLLDVAAALDLAMMMGGGDAEVPPISLDASFGVTIDEIGGSFDVVAPESYEALTPAEIQEMGSMLSSVAGGF